MGWPKPKTEGNNDVLKLKDGETRLIHVLSSEPTEVRTVFHSVLKTAVTLPESYPKAEGQRYRYGVAVYDYTDQKAKPWFFSVTTAEQIKAYVDAYKGFENMDVQISRKGSGFNDTKYTIVALPTKYKAELLAGQDVPNLTALTQASTPAELEAFFKVEDPQIAQRQAIRDSGQATAKQVKFLESLIDRKKIDKPTFSKMLEVVDSKPDAGGTKFIPEKITVGQVSKLIDMLKEYA